MISDLTFHRNGTLASLIRGLFLFALCLFLIAMIPFVDRAYGKGRLSEIVLPFDREREIHVREDLADTAVIIEFRNTAAHELKALDFFDESVVKKILIRDEGTEGIEVKIYLKDENLKVASDIFKEPFRLVLTIFDSEYKQMIDPITGIPDSISENKKRVSPDRQDISRESDNPFVFSLEKQKDYQLNIEKIKKSEHKPYGERKLLQPLSGRMDNNDLNMDDFRDVPDGRGKYWSQYPYYIYPSQTAPYEGRNSSSGWDKKYNQDYSGIGQKLAEYAYKMYSFGNEQKAIFAYQKVLHHNPSVFDKDVLHLWAFAECHLGAGNLTLADGYFDAVMRKFPESPLSAMAYIKRLDIQSIRMIRSHKPEELAGLVIALKQMDTMGSGEISAQKYIRMAYWTPPLQDDFINSLPSSSKDIVAHLESSLDQVESQKTLFLISSILIKNFIESEIEWTLHSGKMVSDWLTRYTDQPDNPFYKSLKKGLDEKLSSTMIRLVSEENFHKSVKIWNSLPEKMKHVIERPKVIWALSESFRNTNLYEEAIPFYKKASNQVNNESDRFKSLFWISSLSAKIIDSDNDKYNEKKKSDLKKQAVRADDESYIIWKKMMDEDKHQIILSYKQFFENTIDYSIILKTPPRIILASLESTLSKTSSSDAISAGSDKSFKAPYYTPSGELVRLLQKLVERFRSASMTEERRRAIRLMKKMSPEQFKDDVTAVDIWTRELSGLANEYRQSGEYLKAGRLFTYTAENSYEWNKRAESLYKGGLLLYRAGKREEAISALKKASQDGNNLFYANLAKERLTQLLP